MNWSIALAILIAVIYPAYIVIVYKKANDKIHNVDGYRIIDYRVTILLFWIMTFLVLVNYLAGNPPSMLFYLTFNTAGIVASIIILGLVIFQSYQTNRLREQDLEKTEEQWKDVLFYLPGTRKEFWWFMGVSISAGICEEIIFRLFLFEFLKIYIGLIGAILLANVIFALTHIGTGQKNLIGAFITGLIFSAIYYFTENIWIAVVLHAFIDINSGIIGYKIKSRTGNGLTAESTEE